MGATLPLLVVHLVRRSHNVGVSVGTLYFVNTLGAAAVCFVAVIWLFGTFGKTGTLTIAAAINFLVGGAALAAYGLGRKDAQPALQRATGSLPGVAGAGPKASQTALRFPLALFVVAVIGCISLSYEILWVRVYSFLLAGNAAAFPLLLGAFLAGIALGSWFARRYCRNIVDLAKSTYVKELAYFVLFATAIGYFVVPGMAYASSYTSLAFALSLVFVTIGAALFGATLPLVSHLAIRPDDDAGAGLSYLYPQTLWGRRLEVLSPGLYSWTT